jgi:hypothetical protein
LSEAYLLIPADISRSSSIREHEPGISVIGNLEAGRFASARRKENMRVPNHPLRLIVRIGIHILRSGILMKLTEGNQRMKAHSHFAGDALKTLAVRISFAFLLALTLVLAKPINAQTTYFNVGDSVEAMGPDGKWASAVVLEACDRANGCYGYTVVQGSYRWFVKSAYIRAHSMTPAEQAEADKTAAELAARASSGNGIGAQYGVREPTTCKSRTAPPSNAPNAKQYVLCDAEGFDGVENVNLLSDLNVQVAPARAFIYTRDSGDKQIDVKAPLYDIRGSYKQYQCGKPHPGNGAFAATHNCILYDQPQAMGSCYRDTFGDWHCSLTGSRLASTGVADQMAPR